MKNWLKAISDETRLCDINIPGTHDSCARFIDLKYFTKCQSKTIGEQLNIGIRFLDTRLEAQNGRLKTVHGYVDCRKKGISRQRLLLDDVLSDVTSFLKENPSETVLLCIKRDDGISPKEVYRIFIEEYVKGNSIFLTENRMPTLGEARGKIVVLNRCDVGEYTDEKCGINLTNWQHQGGSFGGLLDKEIPIYNTSAVHTTLGYYLQDFYTLPKAKKWRDAVLPTLKNAHTFDGIVFNFFSANNNITSPKICARYIFKQFKSFELQGGKKYGWLILDFPEKEITEKIVKSNFKH